MDQKIIAGAKEVKFQKAVVLFEVMVSKIDLTCIKVGIVAFSFSGAIIRHKCERRSFAYPFTLSNPE